MPVSEAHSHSGWRGKSLVEKIRDELDEAYGQWQLEKIYYDAISGRMDGRAEWFVRGICSALGILRSTSQEEEFVLAAERYANALEREAITVSAKDLVEADE